MFRSGAIGADGHARVETTVCPVRLLEDAPDTVEVVEWWLEATAWDGMTGSPGLPEWPFPGGLLHQPAKLAAAVSLLRSEWQHVPHRKAATR